MHLTEFIEMLKIRYPRYYSKNIEFIESITMKDIKNSEIDLLEKIYPYFENNDITGFLNLLYKYEEEYGKLGSTITSILLGIKITMI